MHNKIIKRSLDLVVSFIIIIFVLSWLFPILALLIKLSSKGPVFFKQKRVGLDNKIFLCIKFRTMYVNNKADTEPATKDDTRITHIGKYLRKYHLDEFPQFFNVILGDMSVVGPRPHMLKQTKEYSNTIEKYIQRNKIKPGITGLAQLTSFGDEISYFAWMQRRIEFDIFYIDNWSLWFDLRLIFLTVLYIIKGG